MRLYWLTLLNVILLIAAGAVGVQVTDGFDTTSVPLAVVFYGLMSSLIALLCLAMYRGVKARRP